MLRCKIRQTINLTPSKAKEFLAINEYKGQRTMRVRQVNHLKSAIEKDVFIDGYIVTACLNGKKFLMNGQHTCRSVMETGKSVQGFLSDWQCDNEEDMVMLYDNIDQGDPRGLGDCSRTRASYYGIDWNGRVRSLVVSCAATLEKKRESSRDERAALMNDYRSEGDFINNMVIQSFKMSKHILRQPVVMAMIQTYRSYPEGAYIFWKRVKDGENITKDMPEHQLREFLKAVAVPSTILRNVRGKETPTSTPMEMYGKCIYAWNCFRRSKRTKVLKYRPGEPIVVI